MKYEIIKKVSNKYSIIKQVYEDKVLIRTNNIIHSIKYNSYMILLSNNSCFWSWNVCPITTGKTQFEDTESTYLVEFKPEDFDRVKTYNKNFEGFYFNKEDEINCYEDVLKIAKEQEDQNLVTKFNNCF